MSEKILISVADEIGWQNVLNALRQWSYWEKIRNAVVSDACIDGECVTADEHRDEIAKIGDDLAEAEAKMEEIGRDGDRLHEAICEGRRQDAIDILNCMTGEHHRSVREQRNLFPDRVTIGD